MSREPCDDDRAETDPIRLLLVEDDANLGLVLQESLNLQGYEVTLSRDGEEGLAAFQKGAFDLCLIDVMLPKKDGFSLARDIRARDDEIPLIFLTAKSLKEDRIEGFRLGGDDYVTKPFNLEELVLRIRAVLKRCRGRREEEAGATVVEFGAYRFDYTRRNLYLGDGCRRLTHKEAELLYLLCRNRNRVVARQTALERIWGNDSVFSARSMDVYISKLRKHLSEDPSMEILNVHGTGYTLVVPTPGDQP